MEDGPVSAVVTSYARAAVGFARNDVSSIKDREGAGRIRFTRYWLESPRGTVVESAISGEEVHVCLEYEGTAEVARNCRMSITVDNLFGQQFFICSSELTLRDEVRLGKKGVAVCTIPRFPVTAGDYALSLYVESNREVEDLIQSSARISVIDGDFFGTGRQTPKGWEGKCVMVPHSWSIPGPDEPTNSPAPRDALSATPRGS
jgi:lipopolysaccharide transport system ATP-binding protein